MAWTYLTIAGLLEVGWAIALRLVSIGLIVVGIAGLKLAS